MNDIRTLTVKEAAKATGIPARTLRDLATRQRKIAYYRAPTIRFRIADLAEYLESTRQPAALEPVTLASGYTPKHL